MKHRLAAALVVVTASTVACSDDDASEADAPSIDAALDAAADAAIDAVDAPAACGADYQFTGEYVDWDSTSTAFAGIPGSVWTVVGDPSRTATTAPNGRVILCLPRTTVTLSVVQSTEPYIEAQFVADPAVMASPGANFSMRGIKFANRDTSYAEVFKLLDFGTTHGQVLVFNRGNPANTTLFVGPAGSYVSGDGEDLQWQGGGTGGVFTLFPNLAIPGGGQSGTVTLGGTNFVGPSVIPVEAGELTFVTVTGI